MHIWACNEVDTLLSSVVLSGKLLGACYNLFLGVPRMIKDIPRGKSVMNRLCFCSP